MKTQLAEISQRTGISFDAERRYVYDQRGRLVERHLLQGPIREDMTWQYNDRGDPIEWTRTAGGFQHPTGEMSEVAEPPLRCWSKYEYDSYGNWVGKTDVSKMNGQETKNTCSRQIVYFD